MEKLLSVRSLRVLGGTKKKGGEGILSTNGDGAHALNYSRGGWPTRNQLPRGGSDDRGSRLHVTCPASPGSLSRQLAGPVQQLGCGCRAWEPAGRRRPLAAVRGQSIIRRRLDAPHRSAKYNRQIAWTACTEGETTRTRRRPVFFSSYALKLNTHQHSDSDSGHV